MQPIFQSRILIYLSKENLDVKILFANIGHLVDPEIRSGTNCLQKLEDLRASMFSKQD